MTATKTPVTLYDDSTVMPDGWCTMTVTDNSNNKHHLNFLVMNTGQRSLLALNTCLDLSLIKMNESVHLVSEELLENILMQSIYNSVCACQHINSSVSARLNAKRILL